MTTVLTPSPKQQFFDNNGNPLVGGKLFVYQAGTTTKATTYSSSTGLSTNSNPIILDFRGECNLWIDPNVAYKYVLAPSTDTDPPTKAIYTVDQLRSSQLVTLYGGSDTGTGNSYLLNFTANFTSYTDGIVIYWLPTHTNTAASTVNVNGLGAVAIVNLDGSALSAGQIASGRVVEMIYKSTGFVLLNTEPTNVWGGTSTGVSGAYVLAATQFAAYRAGVLIYWIPNVTYTGGGCTINVNGLGAASIFNPDGTILVANQIIAGQVAQILYTGSYFILINGSVSSGTFTGTLTGMTTTVTASVQYYVSGNIVTLSFSNKTLDKTGTSNSTAMKMTGIPNVINPTSGTISTQFCGYVIDNSTARSAQAQVFNNEVNFFLGFDATTLFTAAGTKGLNKNWTLMYQLN